MEIVMNKFIRLSSILVVLGLWFLSAGTARAASSYSLTCSSFSVKGTTDTPYVGVNIFAYPNTILVASTHDYGVPSYIAPAPNGQYDITVTFPKQPEGTLFELVVFDFTDATIGHYFTSIFSVDAVPCSTTSIPGPTIPAGFVLRTITCDVAVFNAPDGSPVGSNRIRSGQTWYVNPESKTANGESWTEIFVGGPITGWIPTACVQ
jgi:hypothetical protein